MSASPPYPNFSIAFSAFLQSRECQFSTINKMNDSFSHRCAVLLRFTVFLFSTTVVSVNSTCGALVSQNQYSEVLKGSPLCFRDGCGASNLTSMST